MSGAAICLLVVSGLVIWGGLGASLTFLLHKLEIDEYPAPAEPSHTV